MLSKLPGWFVSEEQSVRDDVAPYVGLSPAQLWREVEGCAEDAMWAVRASGFPKRVLEHQDPLPESTLRALARLREGCG